MHVDPDPIFQALRTLWKGDGASSYSIRQQPALMELRHVIGRAEGEGDANPRESAVAEACKRCILEAANALPSPPPPDRDLARVARILLGLEDGAEHLTFKGRRQLLETRLGISEDQAAHKRAGQPFTLEEVQLTRVAVHIAENEQHYLENPPGASQHFACIDYAATLTLKADPDANTPTAFTLILDQHFELTALRDRATDFLYLTPQLIQPRRLIEAEASLSLLDDSSPFDGPRELYPQTHNELEPVYMFVHKERIEQDTAVSLAVRIIESGIVPDASDEPWIVNEHLSDDERRLYDANLSICLPTPESPRQVVAQETDLELPTHGVPWIVNEGKRGFTRSAHGTGQFSYVFGCWRRTRVTLSCSLRDIDY